MGDLAEELVDIILDMVWRLETHPEPQPAAKTAGAQPQSDAQAARSSTADGDSGASTASSSSSADGGSSDSHAPSSGDSAATDMQQPEVAWRPAKAEVAAWASYCLVCRRWNKSFRYTSCCCTGRLSH